MKLLDCKDDFADFGDVTYLNCAYQGPMPRVAIEALRQAIELETRPYLTSDGDYFDVPDAYRTAVATLIGGRPSEVAVTDSTTHGMVVLARGLDWSPGDEIVLPRGEFPANRFPWLALEDRGVRVREIDLPPGRPGLERLADAIGKREVEAIHRDDLVVLPND